MNASRGDQRAEHACPSAAGARAPADQSRSRTDRSAVGAGSPANEPGSQAEQITVRASFAALEPCDQGRPRRFAGKPVPTATLRALAVVLAFALVTACGFHIRGSYDIPPTITPMYVEGASGNSVAAELRDNLRRNDIELVSPPQAAARLVVSERSERQVLSVGSSGRVDEYELLYVVEWRLEAPDRETPLIPPETLQARRDYTHDPTAILGSEDREGALLEAMREDLATRILFRLQAWSPQDAPAP